MFFEDMQRRSEGVKFTAWEVRPQDWNFKELAGAHYKECGVRFNSTPHGKSYQGRRQNEGQIKGFT